MLKLTIVYEDWYKIPDPVLERYFKNRQELANWLDFELTDNDAAIKDVKLEEIDD